MGRKSRRASRGPPPLYVGLGIPSRPDRPVCGHAKRTAQVACYAALLDPFVTILDDENPAPPMVFLHKVLAHEKGLNPNFVAREEQTPNRSYWKDYPPKWRNTYYISRTGKRIVEYESITLLRRGIAPNAFSVAGSKHFYQPICEGETDSSSSTLEAALRNPLGRLKYYKPSGVPDLTVAEHEAYQAQMARTPPIDGPCNTDEGENAAYWFVQDVPPTNEKRDMRRLYRLCEHKLLELQKFALVQVTCAREKHRVLLAAFEGRVDEPLVGGGDDLRYEVPVGFSFFFYADSPG